MITTFSRGHENLGHKFILPESLCNLYTMEFLLGLGIESQGVLRKPPKEYPYTLSLFPLQKSMLGRQNYFGLSTLQSLDRKTIYYSYNEYKAIKADFSKKNRQLIRHFKPKNFCSKKFSVKMFIYLLELSIRNAEILYNIKHKKKMSSSKDFRLFLAKVFLKESSFKPKISSSLCDKQVTVSQMHMPNKEKKRGFCDFCRKSKVNTFCTRCRTFLCIKDCFEKYHNNLFDKSLNYDEESIAYDDQEKI